MLYDALPMLSLIAMIALSLSFIDAADYFFADTPIDDIFFMIFRCRFDYAIMPIISSIGHGASMLRIFSSPLLPAFYAIAAAIIFAIRQRCCCREILLILGEFSDADDIFMLRF